MESKPDNNKTDPNEKGGSNSWFKRFIFKHKVVLFLLLVIAVVFIWSLIKINNLERRYEKQAAELATTYEVKFDSLVVSNMELTTRVFTWAVRSEMMRDNIENVNRFFGDFIKIPNVTRVNLVDPESLRVIISTDRKDEGEVVAYQEIYDIDELSTIIGEDKVLFINPVMGLDRKHGILVIYMNRE